MNIPTRYILAATHTMPMNEMNSNASDTIISHAGMPNGTRAIITIGDVNGMIDIQNATGVFGSVAAPIAQIRPMMTGTTVTV